MIKQAKKLNERLRISATKNKNTVLHVYNSKIGGLEERLFETRVDPGKMHESNLMLHWNMFLLKKTFSRLSSNQKKSFMQTYLLQRMMDT